MTLTLGRKLKIRAMVHVAGEPIPNFWPMRTFIHHNPLFGLEKLPFEQAVAEGERLFHARGFLPRAENQRYLADGRVDTATLEAGIARFLAGRSGIAGLDTVRLLYTLTTAGERPLTAARSLTDARAVHAALAGKPMPADLPDAARLRDALDHAVDAKTPVYVTLDRLYGSTLGSSLDELVIKGCLDFFDEGQSVWQMPGREQGLFCAWKAIAQHNLRLFLRGIEIKQILAVSDTPEGVIAYVMDALGVPEEHWIEYFTAELTRLHGWAGFIRWRAGAKHYYWARRYPADLVDYLAIRLTLGLALINEYARRKKAPATLPALIDLAHGRPGEVFLRAELHAGRVLPALAHKVEDALASRGTARIDALLPDYLRQRRDAEARTLADGLKALAIRASCDDALLRLNVAALGELVAAVSEFEAVEGPLWLRAMEAHYRAGLLAGIDLSPSPARDKRPFAQLLFCIDVRSERIRRHIEAVGDYQTFGIAGFFGVPVSFVGLDKGSETHLAPVVVTPKNLVLELGIARNTDEEAFVSALEHVFHDLKASVLAPFVTVEAIGLLFGLDMFGKSLAPLAYNRWRQKLHPDQPDSRLLLDKLTLEQADSIIRSVQRALIVRAIHSELKITREAITDEMIRELRETALRHREGATGFARHFGLHEERERSFIDRLRRVYRINRGAAQLQLEQLGRIGFSLDEQVRFVVTALKSIGLTQGFSRFVLLCGHGSMSENNPYESALDCGACGGNHGLVSARVLAQIANKPAIRERLRPQGIDIPDDAWFVPAFHNTTTDELRLYELDLLPPAHLVYVDRLTNGLSAASRLCAAERIPTLDFEPGLREVHPVVKLQQSTPREAYRIARRNAMDWSQVRPEWGLSKNAAFIIGRRDVSRALDLEGRVFLNSYDWRCDPKGRLLENILAGPLVVGQWINMEHYFSAVDNQHFGSGSKVYHNVAGRFGVMTGNLSDLRTGLPSQTVLKDGRPYHQPMRLQTLIEAPFEHARRAIDAVAHVRNLVRNGWVRLVIVDPETGLAHLYEDGGWQVFPLPKTVVSSEEVNP